MAINKLVFTVLCSSAMTLIAMPAHAVAEKYIGEIFMTAANFCPRGTVNLDGQLLSISSNTALFSILGTTYGGDGRTTFAVPDMRGRTAIHTGKAPKLNAYRMGDSGGNELIKLKGSGQSAEPTTNGGLASADQTMDNRAPYVVVRSCMVTKGIFPSRN